MRMCVVLAPSMTVVVLHATVHGVAGRIPQISTWSDSAVESGDTGEVMSLTTDDDQ
jgi:hypothetical protein